MGRDVTPERMAWVLEACNAAIAAGRCEADAGLYRITGSASSLRSGEREKYCSRFSESCGSLSKLQHSSHLARFPNFRHSGHGS